jgi:hypothetical protein
MSQKQCVSFISPITLTDKMLGQSITATLAQFQGFYAPTYFRLQEEVAEGNTVHRLARCVRSWVCGVAIGSVRLAYPGGVWPRNFESGAAPAS